MLTVNLLQVQTHPLHRPSDPVCQRDNNVKEEPGWAFTVTRTGRHDTAGSGPHTMRISTPAGTAYASTAPPLLGWGCQDPPESDRPVRALMGSENRILDTLQARLHHGEDFSDADWHQYGHLTQLAAG